jgi:hypothetical protein
MRAVLQGLRLAYRKLGHEAFIVSPLAPRAAKLAFAPLRGVRRVRSSRELARALRESGADLAHLHFSGWMRPWLRPLASAALPCPLVLTFQDFEHPELPGGSRRDLRALARRADAVTAVSRELRRRLVRALPELRGKVRVVPNGAAGG